MQITLNENERIEDLQCKGLQIIQNKKLYSFTSDSVVLANFISTKKKDVCVEIGSGSGVISILLSAKMEYEKCYAFEIQEGMFQLLEKNVLLNNLKEKIIPICDDVANFKKYLSAGGVDVVFSNPPYMRDDVSHNESKTRDIARHDSALKIDKLCEVASKMLKFGGKFYLVYTAERTAELICQLIKNNLQPKRMFFTENGRGRVVLVVIEAVKGGKSGVKVLPQLTTNEADGKYLENLQTKYVK
ncbi:MAG: methyltransferase [Clostridia bacterium]|nr:methyltransferase [Clostridia bacterium]